MTNCKRRFIESAWLTLVSLTLVGTAGCGNNDQLSPSEDTASEATPSSTDSAASVPTDSIAAPVDSTLLSPDSLTPDSGGVVTAATLAAGTQPGIVFG